MGFNPTSNLAPLHDENPEKRAQSQCQPDHLIGMPVRTGLDVPCLLDHLVVDFPKEVFPVFQSAGHPLAGRLHLFPAHFSGCRHQGACILGESPDVVRDFSYGLVIHIHIGWLCFQLGSNDWLKEHFLRGSGEIEFRGFRDSALRGNSLCAGHTNSLRIGVGKDVSGDGDLRRILRMDGDQNVPAPDPAVIVLGGGKSIEISLRKKPASLSWLIISLA